MRRFAALFAALDATTKTLDKQRSLEAYFRDAPPADAAWATFFLTGRRLKRLVRSRDLRDAAVEEDHPLRDMVDATALDRLWDKLEDAETAAGDVVIRGGMFLADPLTVFKTPADE